LCGDGVPAGETIAISAVEMGGISAFDVVYLDAVELTVAAARWQGSRRPARGVRLAPSRRTAAARHRAMRSTEASRLCNDDDARAFALAA
jgi:hypothetical protein